MREIVDLNFNWYYTMFKETYINDYQTVEDFKKVSIPHNMVELNYNYNSPEDQQIVGIYRRVINIKSEYLNKKVILKFDGVAHKTQIFINGNYITTHYGGYDEFDVDISEFVNYGKDNYLSVVVNSKQDENIPPFGSKFDFLGYGGIYREVSLIVHNEDYIEDAFLKLMDFKSKVIGTSIYTTTNSGEVKISFFEDQELKFERTFEIADYSNNFTFKFEDLIYWDLDNPKLYNVKFEYFIDGNKVDEIDKFTGFREIKFTKKGFYLNGKLIKLIGLNRHQSYPYVGYAMPKSAQELDAKLLKYELGVNIVRTSHYIQSKHFLNKCDEIGLLVFEEIPGWNYIGNEIFKDHTLKNLKAMITRDYHHPSIIMWGVRINESIDDDFYIETNRLAKLLDSSRPTGGVRNFSNSKFYEDVYTFNDFSSLNGLLTNPKKVIKNAPYLVTEHTGHLLPTKSIDNENKLITHALRHYKILEDAFKYKNLSGVIGWSMFDYHTNYGFGSEDLISYHGVLDMYRLPKYAASIYKLNAKKEAFIDVLSSMKIGEYDKGYIPFVYVATNVEYIKLYRDDYYIGSFYPDKKSPLNHSLIKVDDFFGDIFIKVDKLTKSSSRILKKLYPDIFKYGHNLPLWKKLKVGYVLKRNKLTISDLEKIFYKYASMDSTFRFDGIIKGVVAISKIISSFNNSDYIIELDSEELVHDKTYDVTRVIVKKVDQDGNLLRYATDVVSISVNKSLEVIGKHQVSLNGGQIAFWVKSLSKDAIGEVKIKVENKEYIKKIIIK